ncbi:hypothetical protein Nans01_21220 [Nocardiopsis ansamitocini]|uniref:Uncharacterized protein n=1 Tax=Nocardiopsis ansamitocini TaxID=1670832 RepID=A0A9W6P601_9ACTN|nr:hypothetical protein Nans01_21220 [Nocardiopsis ansamitocini]
MRTTPRTAPPGGTSATCRTVSTDAPPKPIPASKRLRTMSLPIAADPPGRVTERSADVTGSRVPPGRWDAPAPPIVPLPPKSVGRAAWGDQVCPPSQLSDIGQLPIAITFR